MIDSKLNLNNTKFEIGKIYPLRFLIEGLEKNPDIKFGHIVVMGQHLYHINKKRLEEIEKDIDKKLKKMKEKNPNIPNTKALILSIIDPYTKYEKYVKFYNSVLADVEEAVLKSRKGEVATKVEDLIKEANGFESELNEKDFKGFLNGMSIFFQNKGIYVEIWGKYIIFRKPGIDNDNNNLIDFSKFKSFYENIQKDVEEAILKSKKGKVASPVEEIILEAKKMGFDVEGKEFYLLKYMKDFFKETGIKISGKYAIFGK